MTSRHYVYLLECADGSLYTGYTTDLERRLAEHNDGTGAKYTRVRLPVALSYAEEYESRSVAMRREYEIKQRSHDEKRQLIDGDCAIALPDVASDGTGPR